MKPYCYLLFFNLSLYLLFPDLTFCQTDNCKILIESLVGEYSGQCKNGYAHGKGIAKGKDIYEGEFKKGLPHGKGKYIWSSGEIYEGSWKHGKRHGDGKFILKIDNNDTIIIGNWSKDKYSPQTKSTSGYKVNSSFNIQFISIRRHHTMSNSAIIKIQRDGLAINPTDLAIDSSSGAYYENNTNRGFDNIIFPVTLKISYQITHRLNLSTKYDCSCEIEINEPGSWEVIISN